MLFYNTQPVLPKSLWQNTFDLLRSNPTSGHLGAGRTLQRLSRLYYFPKQKEWAQTKNNTCEVCQKVKRSHTTPGSTSKVHSNHLKIHLILSLLIPLDIYLFRNLEISISLKSNVFSQDMRLLPQFLKILIPK